MFGDLVSRSFDPDMVGVVVLNLKTKTRYNAFFLYM